MPHTDYGDRRNMMPPDTTGALRGLRHAASLRNPDQARQTREDALRADLDALGPDDVKLGMMPLPPNSVVATTDTVIDPIRFGLEHAANSALMIGAGKLKEVALDKLKRLFD